MDLYENLGLQPIRQEPDVWVRRLVIYKAIRPDPIVVRNIPLSKGLNIVWAAEPEGDAADVEMTGHSAGKTTFCRLLRYVLGETTYGNKSSMALITGAFPDGYVGAELFVQKKLWAVVRPIGTGRSSRIKQNATLEELLADNAHSAYQQNYPKKVGFEALLDDLGTGAVVRTEQPIEWNHILAWCTRDQEARFQDVHNWRSPRSQSDWPAFRFPKADPLFVMRAVLGLLLPDELREEEKLAGLLQKKDELEKKLEEMRREPDFRVNLYDAELRRRLCSVLPDEPLIETMPLHSGNLLPDLDRVTDKAAACLEEAIDELEEEAGGLQREIEDATGVLQNIQSRLLELVRLFDVDQAALREIDEGLAQRLKDQRQIDKHAEKLCPFGKVLIRKCEYVLKRQRVLRQELQDAHAMEQLEAARAEEKRGLRQQLEQMHAEARQVTAERQSLRVRRDGLLADIEDRRSERRELLRARQELEAWTRRRDRAGGYPELDACRRELGQVEEQIAQSEERLAGLLTKHDENRELLASIYSGTVRAALPAGNYDGQVSLANRELEFSITHGPTMSGEAVETLSVLLADVSCLVYNSVSKSSHLPGFLVHDSPREADLGLRIYCSFIRFIATLQEHFATRQSCPFQYIITTTTPPPPELQSDEFVRLRLQADGEADLLLRCNVAALSSQGQQSHLTG